MSTLFSTTIWLNVTSIFALLYAIYLCSRSDVQLLKGNSMYIVSLITIFLTTVYIGTRPITSYADTWLYTTMFNLVQSGIWSELPGHATEPFWQFVELICIETTTASGWLMVITLFTFVVCLLPHIGGCLNIFLLLLFFFLPHFHSGDMQLMESVMGWLLVLQC